MQCPGEDLSKMQRLAPGVYRCDENHMHLDAEELLIFAGYPASERNQLMLEAAVQEMAAGIGAQMHSAVRIHYPPIH